MPRARKRPAVPGAAFDVGAGVLAQGAAPGRVAGARGALLLVAEPLADDANGRVRWRAVHVIEQMGRDGALTRRQEHAGMALANAWEATMRTPARDLSDPVVDRTPDPEARTMVQQVAVQHLARLMRQVPGDAVAVVRHVCHQGRALRDGMARNGAECAVLRERLVMALDVVADWLDRNRW